MPFSFGSDMWKHSILEEESNPDRGWNEESRSEDSPNLASFTFGDAAISSAEWDMHGSFGSDMLSPLKSEEECSGAIAGHPRRARIVNVVTGGTPPAGGAYAATSAGDCDRNGVHPAVHASDDSEPVRLKHTWLSADGVNPTCMTTGATLNAVTGREKLYMVDERSVPDGHEACSASEFPTTDGRGTSSSLPCDFKLQLQILELVAQQGQLMERLAEQQQSSGACFTAFRQHIEKRQPGAASQLAEQLDVHRCELKELKASQQETTDELMKVDDAKEPVSTFHPEAGSKSEGRLPRRRAASKGSNSDDGDDTDDDEPQSALVQLVTSGYFEALCATVIILNAITIGISAEYSIMAAMDNSDSAPGQPAFMETAATLFLIFYTTEAIVKMTAFRSVYFCGPDWRWNIFDVILVVTAQMENLAKLRGVEYGGQNMTWLRTLRLLKMLKMLRVVRVMRFFSEMRKMLMSIIASIGVLGWSILMLFLMMFIFGLCFLGGVTGYLDDTPIEKVPEETMELVLQYWCSVSQGIITLYFAITGGMDWEVLAAPLREAGSFYYCLFLFYIAFAAIAVLNVLTGMFCDAAMAVAVEDEANVEGEFLATQPSPEMRALLKQADTDGTNMISLQNILEVKDEEEFVEFKKAVVIEDSDITFVHKTLATKTGSHDVDIDDFLTGCVRAKGHVEDIHMVSFVSDVKKYFGQVANFMEYIEERFDDISTTPSTVKSLRSRLAASKLLPVNWQYMHEELDC